MFGTYVSPNDTIGINDSDSIQRAVDMAKESGTTVSAIRDANHLADIPAYNTMLIIPIS